MKVNDIKEVAGLPEATPVRSSPSAGTRQDKVSVSSSHEVMSAIEGAKSGAGVGRSERLRQLEQSIKSGSYQPNAAQIADQILDDAELSARLQAMLRG